MTPSPNLTKLLDLSILIRGKSVSDMHIDRCKDDIITELTETLNWIMPKFHLPYHEGELLNCGKATCEAYRTAIAKVEALAAKVLEKE